MPPAMGSQSAGSWRHGYYWGLLIARALLTYLIFIDVAYNAKLLNLTDAFKLHQLGGENPAASVGTTNSQHHQASSRRSIRSSSSSSSSSSIYSPALKDNSSSEEETVTSSPAAPGYLNDQPAAGTDQACCACDEAKYELVFEGLWSRYTHPDDFPENYWLAHFSDIIGASHSSEFRMWSHDTLATDGVRELAETGSTKKLEAELKQVSSKTRTIIKARELRYPLLNGKTSAVFRTDRQHHLVSILSKLNPSPDWILGVAGLELCQLDCSWAQQRVVNLYLWDAGTDSGTSFTAPDSTTRPQERIHPYRKEASKLMSSKQPPPMSAAAAESFSEGGGVEAAAGGYQRRSYLASVEFNDQQQQQQQLASGNYFADTSVVNPAESSFASSSSSALQSSRPYARLTITRQRIYEKSCNNNNNGESIRKAGSSAGYSSLSNVNPIEWAETTMSSISDCRYTDWSDWSTCSSNCGKGIRTRTRGFVDEQSAHQQAGCSQSNLIEKEICLSECMGNVTCVTRDWSEWSRCSVTCGQGIRKRTRSPIGQMKKACGRIELSQTEVCIASHNIDCSLPDPSGCELSD